MRRRSQLDWSLERERQEVLALRDRRYHRNVVAVCAAIAVLLDPFSGGGGVLGDAAHQVRPHVAPDLCAPAPAPRHGQRPE